MQNSIIESKETIECCEIKWEQVKKLMEFQEISIAELAKRSGTPESSLRKYLRGEVKDIRISSLVPIARALNASVDKLLGLSPPRDFERESETYDPTLMDNMRRYLDETIRASNEEHANARAKIAEQVARLEFKAGRIHELELENAALKANMEEKDKTILILDQECKRRRKALVNHRWAVLVFAFLSIALCVYFIWEIMHITEGLTGMLYPNLLK